MASWKTTNGRLTKFFAFKTVEACESFKQKLTNVESTYDTNVTTSMLGDKALVVKTKSNLMKDHTLSKTIDNKYNGIWESYNKTASMEKEAINIAPLLGAGADASKWLIRNPVSSAVGRGTKWVGQKAYEGARGYARAARDTVMGHGAYPGARAKQLGNVLDDVNYNKATNIKDHLDQMDSGLGNNKAFQDIQHKMAPGSSFMNRLNTSDFVTPHMKAVQDLTGQTPAWKRLANGSMFGIRGRSPLRYEMERATRAGNTQLAEAYAKRMQELSRNRAIGAFGVAPAVLGAAGYASLPTKEVDNTPDWLKSIVGTGADYVSRFSPSAGKLMNNNPWATVGIGGGGLALALYMLMARNNQR